jgi:uncharacterized coiled-coil protein SlyX
VAWTLNVIVGFDPTFMSFIKSIQTTTESKLDSILANQEKIMATLDEVLTEVAKETTDISSLTTFIQGIQQQLADALSGVTLPPDVQAKVDAVFTNVTSNDAAVLAAMAANVPPPSQMTPDSGLAVSAPSASPTVSTS